MRAPPRSHGSGQWTKDQLKDLGADCIFEPGVLIFHPETISIADRVYVGHQSILKGYYKNQMSIGAGTWIGQQCFFHSAGGLFIGDEVGIAPGVKILTSLHEDPGVESPIMDGALRFAPVRIGSGSDIGIGAIILPGVTIGKGVQVGAGAVVTKDIADYAVVVGNPARVLRQRQS